MSVFSKSLAVTVLYASSNSVSLNTYFLAKASAFSFASPDIVTVSSDAAITVTFDSTAPTFSPVFSKLNFDVPSVVLTVITGLLKSYISLVPSRDATAVSKVGATAACVSYFNLIAPATASAYVAVIATVPVALLPVLSVNFEVLTAAFVAAKTSSLVAPST